MFLGTLVVPLVFSMFLLIRKRDSKREIVGMLSLPSHSDNINDEKGALKERKGRFNFARDDKLCPSLFGVAARFSLASVH